jgi:hypothetical protein
MLVFAGERFSIPAYPLAAPSTMAHPLLALDLLFCRRRPYEAGIC